MKQIKISGKARHSGGCTIKLGKSIGKEAKKNQECSERYIHLKMEKGSEEMKASQNTIN